MRISNDGDEKRTELKPLTMKKPEMEEVEDYQNLTFCGGEKGTDKQLLPYLVILQPVRLILAYRVENDSTCM